MTMDLIKSHVDKETYKTLKKTGSDEWVSLMVKKPQIYGALDKAVRALKLEKLSGEKLTALESLAKKVDEVVRFSKKEHPMSKEYSAETQKMKLKGVKGHFNPQAKLPKTGKSLKQLEAEWRESKTKRPFDEWANDKISKKDVEKLKEINVKYLTESERKQYLVKFDGGKLVNEALGKKADGQFIFVLAKDPNSKDKELHKEHLYMAKKDSSNFKHSSFFRGEPVICAGKVELKKGKPKLFNDRSGHYKPTREMMENLLKFLKDKIGSDKATAAVQLK